jgi:hypothetical protein
MRTRFGDRRSTFLVRDAVVEDLPDETTEPMRDRADRLRVSETDDETPIHDLKDAALRLDGGIGGLIQEATRFPFGER